MGKHRNLLPKLCLAIVLAAVLLIIVAIASSQFLYWNAPGDLLLERGVIQIVISLAVVVNIIVAAYRAAETHDWLWLFASVLIWPLSFWYTLLETRDER